MHRIAQRPHLSAAQGQGMLAMARYELLVLEVYQGCFLACEASRSHRLQQEKERKTQPLLRGFCQTLKARSAVIYAPRHNDTLGVHASTAPAHKAHAEPVQPSPWALLYAFCNKPTHSITRNNSHTSRRLRADSPTSLHLVDSQRESLHAPPRMCTLRCRRHTRPRMPL